MRLILTHEQADFDGLASVLGATLSRPGSIGVLPRSMNRNVQMFLSAYAGDIPLKEQSELGNQSPNGIVVVDTQSVVSIKGVSSKTPITIFDHHHKRSDLPENWKFNQLSTGSCTTFFVEQLQEQGEDLHLMHATLLLLGIYEDTGSLTYANTTARDASAVAFLLEQGASLKIAARFLNPPLSVEQRVVFESLLDHAQFITSHGCHLMVSHAKAPELADEVSSIAHKLSDLLYPDGLFIFVHTSEGLRMVARSISDQINVARIAAKFGGGGHERAAAALIHIDPKKPIPLEATLEQFIKDLPGWVKPAVTVGKIMSKKPLLLEVNSSAREALELMQRYGYEGFPVVEGDTVVGLLTRRTVDRALAHKLNLPAQILMESGCVSVHPDDTLDHLQHIMADSSWGQVPVIDPASQKIIGIVTRTDLLKTLSGSETGIRGKLNLSTDLETCMPPARLALLKLVAERGHALNLPIYLVGGFVRDLILRKASPDFDFVVEGDALQLAHALASQYGGKVTSHKQFGTAKWQITSIRQKLMESRDENSILDPVDLPESIDLISARTEFYDHPTALPTVKQSSIKLDLHRRDFTINTLALRLDGAHYGDLYDFWGGLADLRARLVRVLHSLSFVDDPTRILRAVRFEQRFGFNLEARTLEFLRQSLSLLQQTSGDRIRHEIELLFKEKNVADVISRLDDIGALKAIYPDWQWSTHLNPALEKALDLKLHKSWKLPSNLGRLSMQSAIGFNTLFSSIDSEKVAALCRRLRFNRPMSDLMNETHTFQNTLDNVRSASAGEFTLHTEKYSLPCVFTAWILCEGKELRTKLEKYALEWRFVKIETDGEALQALGVQPGPIYKQILDELRKAKIDGKIQSLVEERRYLKTLIKKLTHSPL